MSYILDALKRSADEAENKGVPNLRSSQGPVSAKREWRVNVWPWLCVLLLLVLVSLLVFLRPWQRNVSPVVDAAPVPTTSSVTVLGDVEPSVLDIAPRTRLAYHETETSGSPAHTDDAASSAALPAPPVSAGNTESSVAAQQPTTPQAAATTDDGPTETDATDPKLIELFQQAVRDTAKEANADRASQAMQQQHQQQKQKQQESVPDTQNKVFDGRSKTLAQKSQPGSRRSYGDIVPLASKPQAFQDAIPHLTFQAHLYSSDDSKRWVRVNGKDRVEGDTIANGVRLVAILPNRVILSAQGQMFSLGAMTDW